MRALLLLPMLLPALAVCPAGQYSYNGGPCMQCYSATSAYYCPAGATAPMVCPSGYYCPDVTTKTICPTGQYCPMGSTSPIPSTIYQPCGGASQQSSTWQYECSVCSVNGGRCGGTYSNWGQQRWTAFNPYGTDFSYCILNGVTPCAITVCPEHTYLRFEMAVQSKYNPYFGGVETSYSPVGNVTCQPCPTGGTCPSGTTNPCPTGSVIVNGECVACPAGKICRTDAYPGTYDPYDCPAGYICTDSITAYACPGGYYCLKGGSPTLCSLGMGCELAATGPTPCSEWRYCPTTTTSFLCDPGYYCPAGSIAQTPCAAGYFCHGMWFSQAPEVCPAGSYCPNTLMTAPITCPVNKY